MDRLERLMARRLGLTRGHLAERAEQARRLLPAEVRRDLLDVAEAAHLAGHPRIAPQIDRRAVRRAHDRAVAHLTGPGPRERRRILHSRALGALLGRLALVAAGVAGLLLWRGFL
ncbi:hypothetical protein AVJ23_00100 [Pseudoponticoccus marisrubri]|uniref:Uncharacterized protein n=1 Tax=Pseudoponticoccus marisrubri TaxID=1685382 RepID=A0A0W7WNL4_9RHOB|nr:hypothetical protein AVJ23_00100 [Pseudoponticoccus marisrubri]